MDESSKLLLTVAIPTVTVLVGILANNRQLDSLRNEINARFEALGQALLRVEGVLTVKIDALSVRVKALEDAIHSPLIK